VIVTQYPGGKGGAGIAQRIINLIPPHRVYVEPFVGGGAVFRAKAPAASSILADRDPAVAMYWRELMAGRADVAVREGCALALLRSFPWRGDEFVYLDPPYHHDARSQRDIYRYEMDDGGHRELLELLATLPVPWALSGYHCDAYDDAARSRGWRCIDYQAMTRGGLRDEALWLNYAPPATIADYRYVGSNFRERQRIKRKVARWTSKLQALEPLERSALLAALNAPTGDDASSLTAEDRRDIANALERCARQLEAHADRLHDAGDYAAEFPATDAGLLRRAVRIIRPL
jgi:hypothetical protein